MKGPGKTIVLARLRPKVVKLIKRCGIDVKIIATKDIDRAVNAWHKYRRVKR